MAAIQIKLDPKYQYLLRKYNWRLDTNGYAYTEIRYGKGVRKRILLHHLVLMPPKHKEIDHINGNRIDNKRKNLRIVTNTQNSWNRKICKNKKISLKGVSFRKDIKKYKARIVYYKQAHYLGSFNTPEEAHLMYCMAATYYFGEYARGK